MQFALRLAYCRFKLDEIALGGKSAFAYLGYPFAELFQFARERLLFLLYAVERTGERLYLPTHFLIGFRRDTGESLDECFDAVPHIGNDGLQDGRLVRAFGIRECHVEIACELTHMRHRYDLFHRDVGGLERAFG